MHRFYTGDIANKYGHLDLASDIWLDDSRISSQLIKVLRMHPGDQIILFDGRGKEGIYEINQIDGRALHLSRRTLIEPKHLKRRLVLAFSLLKKDKNEWVIQKCTELGVTHFLPIVTDRTEKTGFDMERAQKIIIEASEQCGRHSLPELNEPQHLKDVIGQFENHIAIYVCDMAGRNVEDDGLSEVMVVVGPEGGWSDDEKDYFDQKNIPSINMNPFTLRAETASVSAISWLTQKSTSV